MALEALADMEYPGRFIIIGRTLHDADMHNNRPYVVYGITGRKPPSQARRMRIEQSEGLNRTRVLVEPTDTEVASEGDPELLEYTAIIADELHLAVSNGRHTDDISRAQGKDIKASIRVLAQSLAHWEYEHDEPVFTPRIGGVISFAGGALATVCLDDVSSEPVRGFYEVPSVVGEGLGRLLPTYTGKDREIPDSYMEFPMPTSVDGFTSEAIAREAYEAMGPQRKSQDDFRVAVVAGVHSEQNGWDFSVINRHE